jgi:glutamate-5-semialdehyde dehydrogenase
MSAAVSTDLAALVRDLALRARAASLVLATAPRSAKDAALHALARRLHQSTDILLATNAQDLTAARAAGLAPAMLERLTLTPERIAQIARGVEEVAALPDPVGTELERTVRPNGLVIRKVRVPIGVIAIVYESRPNVTVDCAILCLKAGNAAILRGGKEAFHTNTALAALVGAALADAGLPTAAVQLIPTTDRAALSDLLRLDDLVHCVIPRGGESLIRFVADHSTIPVIKHYQGVCCLYLDREADPDLAEAIVVNAKTSRPSVCNAAEQLLVHRDLAPVLLPRLGRALRARNVELRCDPPSAALLASAGIPHVTATAADFRAEFLDLILAVRLVDSLEDAIAAINRDGSGHSDAIVTSNESTARRFQAAVDSATVYWNASTRFTDGYEFGLGAEIGISTDRLHARGPMGLAELCSYKYLIDGAGQVR